MFVKLSILAFYHRIFTGRKRLFKTSLVIIGIYVVLCGAGSTLEFIVQCLPIHYFWEGRSYLVAGLPPPSAAVGWCMPQTLHLAIPLIAGLLRDTIILLLPAIGLWNLQMSREKKAGVYFALSLGIFACAIEIVRIYYCFQTNNAGDITWTNAGSLVWSGVEPSVAIVCACIPATAPLLKRIRKKITPQDSSSYGHQSNQLRSRIFAKLHSPRIATDGDSMKGLQEGSGSTRVIQDPCTTADDPYSCTIVHGSSPGIDLDPELGIPLHAIQVSKQLDISLTPSTIKAF